LHVPDNMPYRGDYQMLYSVFRNIIGNAIAYSGADTLIITAESDAGTCRFSIADNGVGVSAEHLPHLFERFYRVDKGRSRELGGTGLGLAIAKNAVVLHGGTISASVSSPHGLTLQFTLARAN